VRTILKRNRGRSAAGSTSGRKGLAGGHRLSVLGSRFLPTTGERRRLPASYRRPTTDHRRRLVWTTLPLPAPDFRPREPLVGLREHWASASCLRHDP
jgi:hypothetical protein